MESPCLEVNLTPQNTWLRLDWEGNEALQASLPALDLGSLEPVEALLNTLSLFFPAPLCIVFVVDAWVPTSGRPSCLAASMLPAAPDKQQDHHEEEVAP